ALRLAHVLQRSKLTVERQATALADERPAGVGRGGIELHEEADRPALFGVHGLDVCPLFGERLAGQRALEVERPASGKQLVENAQAHFITGVSNEMPTSFAAALTTTRASRRSFSKSQLK